jgi:predicted MFS family arabinose efflux permease
MAWIYPLYLKNLDFSEIEIGSTSTLLNLIVGMTTLFAYRIERRLKPKSTVWFTTLLITSGFIALGFIHSSMLALCVLVVFYFSRGIATPVLKDYINRITTSDMRATVLSIRSLIIRSLFAIIGPLFGYMTDRLSLNQAFIIIGIVFTFATGSSIFLFLKSLEKQKDV